jgi:predicted negative regulator of RcsB-dependent stress response
MLSFISVNSIQDYVKKHVKESLFAVALIAGAVAIGYGYWLYRVHQEEAAQAALSTCLEELKNAVRDETQWPNVNLASITGYRQHSNASLAPYFLAIEAQSLIAEGKLAEAITTLDRVLSAISKSSPLYYLYAIESAAIKMDSPDDTVKNTGLRDLEALAMNTKNKNRDQALFYLATHYENLSDFARAKEIFHNLVVSFPEGGQAASPWAALAQEKLQAIERV